MTRQRPSVQLFQANRLPPKRLDGSRDRVEKCARQVRPHLDKCCDSPRFRPITEKLTEPNRNFFFVFFFQKRQIENGDALIGKWPSSAGEKKPEKMKKIRSLEQKKNKKIKRGLRRHFRLFGRLERPVTNRKCVVKRRPNQPFSSVRGEGGGHPKLINDRPHSLTRKK